MARQPRNWPGGPLEYVVDAEADLAAIPNPRVGEFALALSEGTIHFHTGTVWQAIGGSGGGAPTNADYLVGTAHGSLSAEIVVGTSPGGELGGTWASPTVDTTHSGSAHHSQSHVLDGSDHTASGLNAGDVLTATSATTFAFQTPAASAHPGVISHDKWINNG